MLWDEHYHSLIFGDAYICRGNLRQTALTVSIVFYWKEFMGMYPKEIIWKFKKEFMAVFYTYLIYHTMIST